MATPPSSSNSTGMDACVASYSGAVVLAILCSSDADARNHASCCARCREHGIEVLNDVPVSELTALSDAGMRALSALSRVNIMYLKAYDEGEMLRSTGGIAGFDAGFSLARIVGDHIAGRFTLSPACIAIMLDAADMLLALGELSEHSVAALRSQAQSA